MLKISLDALEVFEAVAQTGSFAAAADILHKVPSSVSYSIARLEERLDVLLFERNGPKVSLTPAGEELRKEGRVLLKQASAVQKSVVRVSQGFEHEFRFAYDAYIPARAFIEDIRAFQALGCSTQLRFSAGVMTGVWEALKENQADLILAAGPAPFGPGYNSIMLGVLEFVFCVAPNHPFAQIKTPLTRQQLLDYPAIVVADSARVLPTRTIGVQDTQLRVTVSDGFAKIAYQKAGLGHGFLPRVHVADALARGELIELSVEGAKPVETFWLAWRAGDKGEALKWWRQRLQASLASLFEIE